MRVLCALFALTLGGCAPAIPTFSGATTTPERRGDLLLGAAYRAPLGALSRANSPDATTHAFQTFVGREGVVAAGAARYGVGRRLDVGVVASGTSLVLDLRYGAPLDDAGVGHVLVSARGFGAWATGEGVGGALGGLEVPVMLTYSASGIYEGWVGAHVVGLAGSGDVNGAHVDAAGVRLGGIAGLLVGFQSLAVLAELAVDYETWLGSQTDPTTTMHLYREGVVLTPAFAVRLRL